MFLPTTIVVASIEWVNIWKEKKGEKKREKNEKKREKKRKNEKRRRTGNEKK